MRWVAGGAESTVRALLRSVAELLPTVVRIRGSAGSEVATGYASVIVRPTATPTHSANTPRVTRGAASRQRRSRKSDVHRVVRLQVVAGAEIEQVPGQRTGSTGNRDRESYVHVTSYELS